MIGFWRETVGFLTESSISRGEVLGWNCGWEAIVVVSPTDQLSPTYVHAFHSQFK